MYVQDMLAHNIDVLKAYWIDAVGSVYICGFDKKKLGHVQKRN